MVNKCDWGAIGRAADAQARLRLGGACVERTSYKALSAKLSHGDVHQGLLLAYLYIRVHDRVLSATY